MKTIKNILPIIAILISSLGLYKTCENGYKIDAIETKYLENASKTYSGNFEIVRPKDSTRIVVRREFIFDATYTELPEDYKLWIIGRHSGNYYFLGKQQSLHIDKINKKISRSGIRIENLGEWEIMLCLVTNKAHEYLLNLMYLQNEKKLPEGIEILKTITVQGYTQY
ncbi:hypothetical protein [Winogradskyella psychrotolerans]|uniref:hypothetical protein n=1 Tax=Winogradskyella psychrotolerans TaxID=1344585 RepID=UPI001C0679A6|nr:hypothetical protein [Winogradskyella psychrotolerans]MBU2928222.1 hypothetical protein [Winogradskyella psychrotolerans]